MDNVHAGTSILHHKCDLNRERDVFFQHFHENVEIHYIIKGEGEFICKDSSAKVGPCYLMLVPPHIYHYIKVDNTQPYERIIINFPIDKFPGIDLTKLFESPIITNISFYPQIKAIYDRMISYEDKLSDKDFEAVISALIQELLIVLKNTSFSIEHSRSVSQLTSKVINYIDEHITEPLDIQTIANDLFISKSHLQNSFLISMKIGLKKYIILKKMTLAHTMIQNYERPTDVAAKLGYSTYSCFYKSYYNTFGIPPRNTK